MSDSQNYSNSQQENKEELARFPALKRYVERLNAEQLNFRTFMIKENSGKYYIEKILIKLSPQGEVKCTKHGQPVDGYDPTPEEAAAIEVEFRSASFPNQIRCSEAKVKILKQFRAKGELFIFYKRGVGEDCIEMVQERRNFENGSKAYLPWTYYSDDKWRCMEPDGLLPFYKPREQKSALIMIHEGAKSAAAAQRIVESRDYHPWKEELSKYEHWGIIGGALAVHRADYSELKKENPVEVVYMCDNDAPGMESLAVVSNFYGKKMAGIYFDKTWPESWDVADKMPDHLFGEENEYIGPSLSDLRVPATWATEEVNNQNGRKKVYRITQYFAEEWLHSVTPEFFVYHDRPQRTYSMDAFNNLVRPFSDVKNTAELLIQQNRGKAISVTYDPGKPCGMLGEGKGKESIRVLNMHVGGSIVPVEGDPTPFKEYMEYLLPKDHHEMIRWMAHLVWRPQLKIGYAVLLISKEQGVGKTTIGEKILAALIGRHNVSKPTASEIVDGAFNAWAANKRLVIIDEIYEGKSYKAYNKMKSIVTEETVQVNQKYVEEYNITNWCHLFATSNHEKALKIDNADRRWFIPEVAEKPKKSHYWIEFYDWLYKRNGLGIIMWYLREELKNMKPITPADRAPITDKKNEIMDISISPSTLVMRDIMMRAIEEIYRHNFSTKDLAEYNDMMLENLIKNECEKGQLGSNKKYVMRVNDIRDFINRDVSPKMKNVDYDLKIEPREIRKIAQEFGFYVSNARQKVGRNLNSYVISTDKSVENNSWRDMIETNTVVVFGIATNEGKKKAKEGQKDGENVEVLVIPAEAL